MTNEISDLERAFEEEVTITQTRTYSAAQLKAQYNNIVAQINITQASLNDLTANKTAITDKYNALKLAPHNLDLPSIDE